MYIYKHIYICTPRNINIYIYMHMYMVPGNKTRSKKKNHIQQKKFCFIQFDFSISLLNVINLKVESYKITRIWFLSSVGFHMPVQINFFQKKEESHISREYGFSRLCVWLCLSKLDLWEKEESQISQEYGFSPVCVRL